MKVIQIKDNDQIQIAKKEFKGNEYIDLRVYFKGSQSDMMLPSKKGITFKEEFLDEVIAGLQELKDA